MKIKQFAQFISESINNERGPIAEILQRVASSAQDNGWNDFIGLDNNSLSIIATQSWTDDDFDYNGYEVSCDIAVEFTITPIISAEYSDSDNLRRLLSLGIASINSIITQFKVVASLTASCEDAGRLEYSDGFEDTFDTSDMVGEIADLSDPEEFGKEFVETLNDWVDEFTQGGGLRRNLQNELTKLESNYDFNDDDDETA